MQRIFNIFLLCLCLSSVHCDDDAPIVELKQGMVQGFRGKSYNGRDLMKFVGIPFAKPPIKSLRYQEPVPHESWPDTWIANRSTTCLQVDHVSYPYGGVTTGTEDCLYLNVYVPGNKISNNKKLDVIVHIHGGAFMFGSSTKYANPEYLLDRDVILATMNYRLGVFGFLSTLDEHQPGNLGMKDQVLALKWVKDNIEYFGGNPDSITLTGLSAGGASVEYHLLSPLSRGLFHRAISVSGSTLNAWTMQENPRKVARTIAGAVGCKFQDSYKLIKCLKSRPAHQLIEATKKLRPWLYNPFSPLSLVVDKASDAPFLPEHPHDLLKKGKILDVPWITSVSTAEGLYPAIDFVIDNKNFEDMDRRWTELAPAILHYAERVPDGKLQHVADQIRKYYIGDRAISQDTYDELVQLIGDYLFVVGVEMSARYAALANKSPVYVYQYNYTAVEMKSLAYLLGGVTEKYGVCHGDDVLFIFNCVHDGKLPAQDEAMKDALLDMWIEFAKTGKSNWKPVDASLTAPINYLYIGSPSDTELRQATELGHRSFWDSLPIVINGNDLKQAHDEL